MNKFLPLIVILLAFSCGGDDDLEMCDVNLLDDISYEPTAFELVSPVGFPAYTENTANPLTEEGVLLGRHLFYDPILSADSTMSCSSCHDPAAAFTDNFAFSTGIDGIQGTRSSMSLVNLAYSTNGFFWDGRSATLEDQALLPVEDPIELHNDWPTLIEQLKVHPTYPTMFRKAFGISSVNEITKLLAAKALAQFETSLVSANSPFDKIFLAMESFPSESQLNGYEMFFDLNPDLPDAECGHCHNSPLMHVNDYRNNGLDSEFTDTGFGAITGNPADMGKFKVTTLRNIALTAPYMHDGRFATLDEVIEHYISGGHPSLTKDPLIYSLNNPPQAPNQVFTDENKADLIEFLNMLTDTTIATNPNFQNPFE